MAPPFPLMPAPFTGMAPGTTTTSLHLFGPLSPFPPPPPPPFSSPPLPPPPPPSSPLPPPPTSPFHYPSTPRLTPLAFLLLAPLPLRAETTTIDFSSPLSPMTHRATGFLHSYTPGTPPDSLVTPLHVQTFRDRPD